MPRCPPAADVEPARPVGEDGFWQRAGSKTGQHAACSSSSPRSSNTWGCDPSAAPAARGAPPGGEQEPVPALSALLQPARGVTGVGSTLATVPLTIFNGKEGWPALPVPLVLVVPSDGAAGLIPGCLPGFQCLWAGCFCRSSSLRHCLPACLRAAGCGGAGQAGSVLNFNAQPGWSAAAAARGRLCAPGAGGQVPVSPSFACQGLGSSRPAGCRHRLPKWGTERSGHPGVPGSALKGAGPRERGWSPARNGASRSLNPCACMGGSQSHPSRSALGGVERNLFGLVFFRLSIGV